MPRTRRSVIKGMAGSLLAPALIGAPLVARASAPLTVGTIKVAHWAGVWEIPQHLPAGSTKVDLVEFKTSLEMIAALTAGNLDVATIGYWHAIRMLDQGAKIDALAGICSGGSRLVVRKGLGIDGWKGLRGKNCATARGSTQDLQFLMALKGNGLTVGDIEYRDLGGNMAVHISALQQKQIDASSMWEPFASQVIQQGLAEELPGLYEGSFTANGIMVATRDTIARRRGDIQAMVTAHVKSTTALANDAAKFLEQAAKIVGFDREIVKMANKNTTLEYVLRKADGRKIATIANEVKYAKTDVGPALDQAFNYAFLEAATGKKAAELGA